MISNNRLRVPQAALRAGVVGAVLLSSAFAASPAFAVHRDDGDDPGKPLGRMKALGLFVGVPIALFLLIALAVSIPSMMRGPKYRPGKEWQAAPEWYGAPDDDSEYGEHPEITSGTVGGELTGTVIQPAEGDGGTSARW